MRAGASYLAPTRQGCTLVFELSGIGLRVMSHNVANRDICDILRHSATFCDMLQHSATFERKTENPTPRPLPPFAARHGGTIGRPRGSVVVDLGGIGSPNFGGLELRLERQSARRTAFLGCRGQLRLGHPSNGLRPRLFTRRGLLCRRAS